MYTFGGGEGGVSGLHVTCLFVELPLVKGVEVYILPGMRPPGAPFRDVVREVSLSLSSVNSVFFVAASLDVSEISSNLEKQLC